MVDTGCNAQRVSIHSSEDEQKIDDDDFDMQIAAWDYQKEELFMSLIFRKIISPLLPSFDMNKSDSDDVAIPGSMNPFR